MVNGILIDKPKCWFIFKISRFFFVMPDRHSDRKTTQELKAKKHHLRPVSTNITAKTPCKILIYYTPFILCEIHSFATTTKLRIV